MKLSLKVEYACQVLAQLGYRAGNKELPHIEELAKAESVPSNYLVQILNELRTAGLINSRRGKQGGYALARRPGEITVGDIMRAVEGDVLAHSGGSDGESSKRAASVWTEISKQFEAILDAVTVEDLMSAPAKEMWYI